MFFKARCTEDTNGRVISKKWSKFLRAWFITVEYEVNGNIYKRRERVTVKRTMGPGKMTVVYALKDFSVNATVMVMFDPDRPKRSYLPDNNGEYDTII